MIGAGCCMTACRSRLPAPTGQGPTTGRPTAATSQVGAVAQLCSTTIHSHCGSLKKESTP